MSTAASDLPLWRTLEPGLYRLHWQSGGTSLATVGLSRGGDCWIAPPNWGESAAGELAFRHIERLELIASDDAEFGRRDEDYRRLVEAAEGLAALAVKLNREAAIVTKSPRYLEMPIEAFAALRAALAPFQEKP